MNLDKMKMAEEYFLGTIINNQDTLLDVIGKVDYTDFRSSDNSIIFKAIEEMYKDNKAIDLVTLVSKLEEKNMLDKMGGLTYLSLLQGSVITSKNIVEYANIIKEQSNKRKLLKLTKEIEEQLNKEISSVEIINSAENEMFKLISEKENRMASMDKIVEKAVYKIEENYKNGGMITGTSTGFTDIDRVTSGLQKQDLIIIAARPSMGKTTLALNIADNVASKGKSVAIFSLEMAKEQLADKMLSAKANVDFAKIKNGQLEENDWEKIARHANFLAQEPIHIDDTAGITIQEIKAQCKRLKMQQDIEVVVIDYLQLIGGNGEKNRENEISNISRGLKVIAKDLDVTVIALSQLSRAPEQRADHRPMLSDLRESGSIEQDGDVIMFLYRDEYYNKETEDKNIAECILAKQRNGRVGTIKLAWLGQYQKFGNLDVYHK